MKMKKFISLILVLAMALSVCVLPAQAVNISETAENDYMSSFATSDTGRMDISYTVSAPSSFATSTMREIHFSIKQYEGNELVQTVDGEAGGSQLLVTDYQNGAVVQRRIVPVSDIIEPIYGTDLNAQDAEASSVAASSVGTRIGYITFNPVTYESSGRRISVYRSLDDSDVTGYVIHGKAIDTLSVIVGAIASVISVFIPQESVAEQIAIAIISALGGSVAGGAIGITFSENVAIRYYDYTITGCDSATTGYDRYTYGYTGREMHVLTEHSDYYDEWFYEGYTPHTWKNDNLLPYFFWNDLWPNETYPQVKSYS